MEDDQIDFGTNNDAPHATKCKEHTDSVADVCGSDRNRLQHEGKRNTDDEAESHIIGC